MNSQKFILPAYYILLISLFVSSNIYASPFLNNYSNVTVNASYDTIVFPTAPPTGVTSITATASPLFQGVLVADPITGAVRITNPKPAGTYVVTVNAGLGVTKSFVLFVTNPVCSQAGFSIAQSTSGGTRPYSVAIGDFNEDGVQDLVSGNFNSSSINIRYGIGDGTFAFSNSISSGNQTTAVAVGDFNNDGHQDIVSASFVSSITIRSGDGAGNFVSSGGFTSGTGANYLALGDFNNDGNLDIACSFQNSNYVSIRLGNGNNTFTTVPDVAVGTGPRSVAIGDFNRDGFLDILVTNYSNNNVAFRTGNGNGTFSGTTNISVGSGPFGLTVGDFNSDGNMDFACTNYLSNSISIRLGDGFGNFTNSSNPVAGSRPISVSIGDFNGDGIEDLAVANQLSNNVSIGIGVGTGGFNMLPAIDGGTEPYFVVTGDFNLDQRQDLAITNYSANNISIRLGAETGLLVKSNQQSITDSSAISLLNNTDFGYVGISSTATRTYTIKNTGSFVNTFNNIIITGPNSSSFSVGGISFPFSVQPGDSISFNLNFSPTIQGNLFSNVELINNCSASNFDFDIKGTGGFPVLYNYQAATVIAGKNIIVSPSQAPVNTNSISVKSTPDFKGILSADPGTGVIQIINAKPAGSYPITVTSGTTTVSFVLTVTDPNCSSGSFIFSTTSIPTGGITHWNVAMGDFDKDGISDLVLPNYSIDSIVTMKGNGAGEFSVWKKIKVGSSSGGRTAVADFNDDGNLDIASAGNNSNSLSIRYGNGAGLFTGNTEIPVGGSASDIIIGDFNNDNHLDIATLVSSIPNLAVFLGDGNASFFGAGIVSLNQPSALESADFNEDGVLDFAIPEYALDQVKILIGNGSGGFTTSFFGVGDEPNAICVADFNRDGHQDLAISNRLSNSVSIRFGNGLGGFSGIEITGGFTQPDEIATGDFNGDGSQDFCVLNPGGVIVRLGNGAGGFSGNQYINIPSTPMDIMIADLNNDNLQDILTSNSSGAICVRLAKDSAAVVDGGDNYIINGAANISVSTGTDFENVPLNHSVTKTHGFDNIGSDSLTIDTIYFTGANSNEFSVSGITFPFLVLSDSLRNFQISFSPITSGTKSAVIHILYSQCSVKDFHYNVGGKGVIQTLGAYPNTTVQTGDIIMISPQSLPSGFTKLNAFTSAKFLGQILADPLTGAVKIVNPHPAGTYTIDLYATGFIIQSFQLVVTNPICSPGNFISGAPISLGTSLRKMLGGDFNNDGNLDLVVLNDFSLLIRAGDGLGGFNSSTSVFIGATILDMELGDMNGDGKQDVVLVTSSAYRICFGNGTGSFSTGFNTTIESNTNNVLIDDFNNDGLMDILTVYSSGNVAVRFQTSTGTFQLRGSTFFSIIGDLVVGEFNGDGFKDIAVTGYQSQSLFVAFGNGLGTFSGSTTYAVSSFPLDVNIIDVNNDGHQDLLVANSTAFFESLLMGNGSGGFTAAPNIPVLKRVGYISIGDFNGDGIYDFVGSNSQDTSVTFYLGNGSGGYASNRIITGRTPGTMVVGDANNDGLQDVIGLNIATNNASVLLNSRGDIGVFGNSILISDGDFIPATGDNTDFGFVNTSNSQIKNYTIQNSGLANLNLNSINISGLNSGEFILTGISLPAIVSPGSSVSFSISFSPGALGLRTTTVTISTSDCEGSYEFGIQGMGSCIGCLVNLEIKLFIEGFYKGNGEMRAVVEPFQNPLICDTVILELHESNPPYVNSFTDTAVMNIFGNTNFSFPYAAFGNSYYIVVRHRNSITTWSSTTLNFSTFNLNYDFTDAVIKAYGSNLSDLRDGNFAIWSGDISNMTPSLGVQDGIIEVNDYNFMESAIGQILVGYIPQDLTGDRVVESEDYRIMQNNFSYMIISMRP